MPDVPRIEAEEARRKVQAGKALLICGYAEEAKCDRIRLEGSLTLSELESRLPSLPRDQELIFYCA